MSSNLFDDYTRDLRGADVRRLFTRDTAEAVRFFARGIDVEKLAALPWYRRWLIQTRLFFVAFTMRLSPARRALYAVAIVSAFIGLSQLFDGFGFTNLLVFPLSIRVLLPHWVDGTLWIALAFAALNLLMLMEVADRLSLKSDLEVARDIQLAMLPRGMQALGDVRVAGATRPANTVGGDFYDILKLADGRLAIAIGDVAGKGSPASLLMALLLAMLRTLVDEGFDSARLVTRLNVQVARHSPASRFITLCYGVYDPRDCRFEYVNAGHLPPLLRKKHGAFERLDGGGVALGLFDGSTYEAHRITIDPGDELVLLSDGVTEAENSAGHPFEETGVQAAVTRAATDDPEALGAAILAAVDAHAGDVRLADDLTVLVLSRHLTSEI